MKRKFLPCSLLCMFLAATTALGNPGDTFYEANLSLTRAARQEKEGDYKAALESGKKAEQLLQSLKTSEPEWNPEWVAGKLDTAAQLQRRVEPLAQKAGAPKKADYSLRPGEQRDFTLQRAYKAHERQKRLWEPFLFSLPPTARNREKRLLPLLPPARKSAPSSRPLPGRNPFPENPFLRAGFLPGRTGMEDSVSEADADTRAGKGGRKWGTSPFFFQLLKEPLSQIGKAALRFFAQLLAQAFCLAASSTATATATEAPTIGLLPMPMRPIISTWAGTEEEPANWASECMRPMVSVMP